MDVSGLNAPPEESGIVIEHGDRISEAPVPTDDRSELDKHKEARGFVKPAAKTEPAPDPVPEAAKPAVEDKKDDRWKDPDTGDTYDMRHKVARRIKHVLEDRGKERARAEQAEKRVNELTQLLIERGATPKQAERQAEATVAADAEPDPGDTTKYPEGQFDKAFIRDMSLWAARQETGKFAKTSQEAQTAQAREAHEAQVITQWQQTLPEARKRYADFDARMASIPNTPENRPIVQVMMGSPVGNDVAYVLATQPDVMKMYAQATPQQKWRLLYHVEAQVIQAQRAAAGKKAPETTATTTAPAPIEPVHSGAGPSGPTDWSRNDDSDQYQRWKAQRQARR